MLPPEGKSDKPYDGGNKAEKTEGIVARAKVSEFEFEYYGDGH